MIDRLDGLRVEKVCRGGQSFISKQINLEGPRMAKDKQKRQALKNRKRKARQLHKDQRTKVGDAFREEENFRSPLHACVMHGDAFGNQGAGGVAVSRRLKTGELLLSTFLVDVFCMGVKNAHVSTVSKDRYERLVEDFEKLGPVESVDLAVTKKFIEDAVEYADKLGFKPHADYAEAMRIFHEADTAGADPILEFGKSGKPCYISGPAETVEDATLILNTLLERAGAGNFTYLLREDLQGVLEDLELDANTEEEQDEVRNLNNLLETEVEEEVKSPWLARDNQSQFNSNR